MSTSFEKLQHPDRFGGGGGQPKRSAWPLFPSFFFNVSLSVLINISCRRISTFAFTNEEGETKEMYALKAHSSQIIYTRMLRDKEEDL